MEESISAEQLRTRVADDLAGFARRFVHAVRVFGPEAGESLLGGYVEWLGVDLVDALLSLPPFWGRELDSLAERFLGAARRVLSGAGDAGWTELEAVAESCRRLGAERDGSVDFDQHG